MREGKVVAIVAFIFLCGAFAINYLYFVNLMEFTKFNFDEARIEIENNNVKEFLSFTPEKPYRTLYRSMQSYIDFKKNDSLQNYIHIKDVECLAGNPYVRNYLDECLNFNDGAYLCMANTGTNEFGCSFGSLAGFEKGKRYEMVAEYELNPENIFRIKGEYYTKFIAYGEDNHVTLNEENFHVVGAIGKKRYYPQEQVVLYIPVENPNPSLNVIEQEDFEYDYVKKVNSLLVILSLLPFFAIIYFWYKYGREVRHFDMPEERSYYPQTNRKPWKVAAYFVPPFGCVGKRMFSTLLVSMYEKKAILIAREGSATLVKLVAPSSDFDKVEKKFYSFLEKASKVYEKSKMRPGYFDITSPVYDSKKVSAVRKTLKELRDLVVEGQKEYLDLRGNKKVKIASIVLTVSATFFAGILSLFNEAFVYGIYLNFAFLLCVGYLNSKTSLFSNFKKQYYEEFLHWKAYSRYMKYSFSIKSGGYDAVAIWNKILVYTTALGISKKVLKQLKVGGIISAEDFDTYSSIGLMSGRLSTSYLATGVANSGSSSGFSSGGGFGGGFSGGGSGGIGGGGGGGR